MLNLRTLQEVVNSTSANMKAIVVVCVLAFASSALALTSEQTEKAKAYRTECLKESGADETAVGNARKGQFVEDPKLYKYVFCFLKKADFIAENGDIKPDVIKAKLSADLGAQEIDKVISKCKSEKGDTPEATAAKFYKCYYETSNKHVVVF